ncbi:TonB-dependent receptor [Pelagerythrobacter marinus]|uniref:TonB-dependent receptor n=1 Tax=Pelagerythrobacter marinus TaxID=538382 RepID=UPI0020368F54|nr:TonB-dependent receptor [Pelagerythrobacter marinus]USA39853.1 TonB-dependent receptor [Pelagerythrobacter marinus]WPZ06016.1 TonB-dependent receptor [Pelagerythrobacter marinus]
MTFRPAFTASALALAAAATPALAQESARQNAQEIVVTAQRENATEVTNGGDAGVLGNKHAADLAFSIRSFDESLILNQQPLTLGEVLENDPTVRTGYGFGNASELFVIRGFALNGDDVGVNGLYGVAPRQIVAPELYGSVQVLNGASAFLNGAAPGGSTIGGSVNLKLKRAGYDPLTRATIGYNADAHFGGSFDLARRFGANGQWGLRVNGAYRDGETAVEREERRTQVIGGALDYDGGSFRAALDLAYQQVRVDSLRPKVTLGAGLAALPAVPEANANYAQDFAYTEMRDVFGTLSLEWDIADNALLYAKAGARDGREEGLYAGLTIVDAATGDANGTALYVPRTDNNEAAEAGIRVDLGETVTHEIVFGASASWQTNRNAYDFRYGPGFAGYATNLYDTPQVAVPASSLVGGDLDDPYPIAKSRLWSAFASDTIGLWDDRVLITGGLRLQTIHSRAYSYFGGGLETVYDDSAVTPVAGIVVKPIPFVSLYANRIEALEQGPTAPLEPGLENPGEMLAPRKSTQYEAGAKLALGRFLYAGLAFYEVERPGDGTVTGPGGTLRYGYVGRQRHRGIEFTVNGEPVEGLRLIAGLSTIDAERGDGGEATGVPGFAANANLEWDAPFLPGLTLTGRMTHTGKQWADAANTLRLDDWTVFDLGARYVVVAGDRPVTLRLTVDNVADTRYWASGYDSFSPSLLQGRPRTVNASVSVDF